MTVGPCIALKEIERITAHGSWCATRWGGDSITGVYRTLLTPSELRQARGLTDPNLSGGEVAAEKAKGVAGWTQAHRAPYGGVEILPVVETPPLNPSLRIAVAKAIGLEKPLSPPTEAPGEQAIVCLCGSSKHPELHMRKMMEETLAGKIVLPMGLYGHADFPAGAKAATNDGDESTAVKQMLDRLHFAKIDLADEVVIITVGGYIGSSTTREKVYAESKGKRVRLIDFPEPTARPSRTLEEMSNETSIKCSLLGFSRIYPIILAALHQAYNSGVPMSVEEELRQARAEVETQKANRHHANDRALKFEAERDAFQKERDSWRADCLRLEGVDLKLGSALEEIDDLRAQLTEREAELAKLAAKWREDAAHKRQRATGVQQIQLGISSSLEGSAHALDECAAELAELAKIREGV